MLTIHVKEQEFYDEQKGMFFYAKPCTVRLEHSLISVSKWESVWQKPFLPNGRLAKGMSGRAEEQSYISCMIMGTVPAYVPELLYNNYLLEIKDYINSNQSATKIYRKSDPPGGRQTVTSELIYYWMIKFSIPSAYEKWHFSRLLMLIDVCNVKENTGKDSKLSAKAAAKHRHELNKARLAAQ
jgi:hypothetical protein